MRMIKNSRDAFARNLGLLSNQDQDRIANTSVAIAGTGCSGGLLAERLTRFGIGKIILADPTEFEVQNLNRQFAANYNTIGSSKAETVANELFAINPKLDIEVYDLGITADTINEIVSAADVIVDEIEYSQPSISVMVHREARKQQKHVFMGVNIGWGASIFCFAHDGITFEEHFQYDERLHTINPLCYLPHKPDYLDDELITSVLSGQIPMPGLSSSVALVAAALSADIIQFIIGKRTPVCVPKSRFIDLLESVLTIN